MVECNNFEEYQKSVSSINKLNVTLLKVFRFVLLFVFLLLFIESIVMINMRVIFVATISTILCCLVLAALLFCWLFKRKEINAYDKVRILTINRVSIMTNNGFRCKEEFKFRFKVKDMDWLKDYPVKIQASFEQFVEEQKQNLLLEEQKAGKPLVENQGKGGFDGKVSQRFFYLICCFFISIFTLGIGFPFAYVMLLKWEYKHTLYDGRRLSFDGTGLQLLGLFFKWIGLLIITGYIYVFFIPKDFMKWKTKHIQVNGLAILNYGTFNANAIGMLFVLGFWNILNIITLFFLGPVIRSKIDKYLVTKSNIYGYSLTFDGKGTDIYAKVILWNLLTFLTFGIYGLFRKIKIMNWTREHIHITLK